MNAITDMLRRIVIYFTPNHKLRRERAVLEIMLLEIPKARPSIDDNPTEMTRRYQTHIRKTLQNSAATEDEACEAFERVIDSALSDAHQWRVSAYGYSHSFAGNLGSAKQYVKSLVSPSRDAGGDK